LEAIEKEGLGADNQTDMLCISYSTPDIAGHAFGPYSLELEDIYVRLDRDLKKLMDGLEKKYGKKGFTIFLTADHAVVPVPQMLVDKKMPGGYFYLNQNMEDLRKSTITEFGADLIEYEENLNIYLNHKRIDSLKLKREAVAQFVAAKVRTWQNVKVVFTSGELGQNTSSDNEWKDMLRKGFELNRSGDVLFILEPGFLPLSKETEKSHQGTSHGSAFNYDGHVPLLWFGAGIQAKDVFTPYKIIDIAPTLTHILNLQRSGAMTGQPIIEVLEK
jgi:arylsulfatase A-like enzyme